MKYIDAEKLIKSVNNYCEGVKTTTNPFGDIVYHRGKIDACKDIRELIASLQQEPRFPQYDNIVEKIFGAGNLEGWEIRDAEMLVALAKEELLKSLQQEQPEVDLEKEIDKWFEIARDDEGWAHVSSKDGTICDDWKKSDYIINKPSFYDFARHFYKLGLNARKEG